MTTTQIEEEATYLLGQLVPGEECHGYVEQTEFVLYMTFAGVTGDITAGPFARTHTLAFVGDNATVVAK